MRSITALSLFNQVVGVKVLDDLDEFIRNNMLENLDAEDEYLKLKTSFVTLMEAKTNIEKAKEQINQLLPIDGLAQSIQQITQHKEQLDQFKEQGNYWFTKKFVELAAQELEKQNAELIIKGIDLSRLREQEAQLTEQQTDLKVQIKSDHVGGQIESLKQRISPLEKVVNNAQKDWRNIISSYAHLN